MTTATRERSVRSNGQMGSAHDEKMPELLKPLVRPGARLVDHYADVVFWSEEVDRSGDVVQVIRIILGQLVAVRLGPFDEMDQAKQCYERVTDVIKEELWEACQECAGQVGAVTADEF